VALEQTWSGLRFLLRRVDHRAGIQLHVLPTTAERLVADLKNAAVPFIDGRRLDGRVAVVLADFDFGADPAALAPLAAAVAPLETPFIAGLDPALLGIDSMAGLDAVDDVAELLDGAGHEAWQTLRADPNASWVFLAANRFLMRLPYGAEHDKVKEFAFEENAAGPRWLWGRAVWALGERIAACFVRTGWGVAVTGQEEDVPLGDLPVRMLVLKNGDEAPVPLEALLSERRALEMAQAGIVALLCRRDGDQAFLAAAPCVHRASDRAARGAEAARRDTLAFAMMVAQVSAGVRRVVDQSRGGSDEIAPVIERLFAAREGPMIEVHAAPDAIEVTPWRAPLRGLPGFTIPLSSPM
jgi:type VI secretion system protein ImpC